MIKTKLLVLWALLCVSAGLRAEWTDVTSYFLKNPSFDGNSNAEWTRNVYASGNDVNYECMEVFNGTFDIYQVLQGLPKGKYRLTVQGYYRAGSNDVAYPAHQDQSEQLTAVLYAGNAEQALHSIYDYSFTRNEQRSCWSPTGSQPYYPNGMSSGNVAFTNEGYVNTLEFEAEGTVQIGIKNENYLDANWCMFDNFKLEYEGEFTNVLVSSLTLSVPQTTLTVGDRITATATVKPSNATVPTLKWESSDPFVFTAGADGSIVARGEGQSTLTVSTTDGSEISKSVKITVKASSNPDTRQWIDLTDNYITNPSFAQDSSTDGWTVNGSCTVRAGSMEFWNNGYFSASQTLAQLPKGHYRLSAQGYHRYGDPDPSYQQFLNNQPDAFARLFAGEQESVLPGYFDYVSPNWPESYNDWTYYGDHFFPNTMETAAQSFAEGGYPVSVEFDVTADHADVEIGIVNNVYTLHNWCIFTNFKLEFNGSFVTVTDLQLSLSQSLLQVAETVQVGAVIVPANALVSKLSWTSSNTAVATVDDNGLVTAVAPGTAQITATTTDGSNISRSVTVTVVREKIDPNALVINEIMASNVDEFLSPAFNYDGWMELYNPTDKAVTLAGLHLSDDALDLKKWTLPLSYGTLPAKGYQIIWFDSNDIAAENAPFKLDVDGGFLHLSDADGTLLSSVYFPASMERVSYARTTDGGETWGNTATPTPGASNNQSTFALSQLSAPLVDQPSRFFDGPFTVTVTIPAGTTLRYTLDTTLPTLENGATSIDGIFQISETTNLRLRLFAEGRLPSAVTTRSYILRDQNYTLPVVSVVGDNRFFYDTEIGVFQRGPNGRPGNGQSSNCNWNMNWERPVNFSYLDADGDMQLNQDVNLEMCGGWSRAWLPHSFKLKGNKELGGDKNLPYPFFTQKPYIRNRTLQIRNGGNDNNARFKDPALQTIVSSSGLNMDCQSYQPVHEFINGQYIGVLNIREPNNKHYVYANYGWDDDEIDQWEMSPDSGYVQKCGTDEAFLELVDVLSPDAANSETYAEICRLLDIDSYVNYMAIEMYLGGTDWPQNNVKAFRLRDGGKFRFVLFDLDGTFATNNPFNTFMNKETYTFDQLYPTSLGRITDHIRFVTLFKNMLQNSDFRRRFIDAFCMMGGSVFEAERATQIINDLQSRVQDAMTLEGMQGYLSNTANNLRSNLSTSRNYNLVNALKNYSQFDLYSTDMQAVTLSSDAEGAQLLINGMRVPTGQFKGYLFRPAMLKAVAPAGYAFQGWKAPVSGGVELKSKGTTWSYYDQGSLDGTSWQAAGYNASSWKQGQAPIGYNNPNVAANTQVSYRSGSNSTFYFRTTVNLSQAPSASDEMWLDYIIDDGLVIYVNGTEAGRYNMPSGTVTYSTYATTYAHDNPNSGSLQLPVSLFKKGTNVIAVEVHNNSASSTDILWEASLRNVSTSADQFYSTDAEISLPAGDNLQFTASYRPLTAQERQQQGINPVRINEVSGSNSSLINEYGKKNDWIELYNTTDEPIDVEGMYLTDNLSKPEKYKISKETTRANTVIPAHGFLLVWCDKLATTDQALHASFKISGEGGVLALTAADKSWTDQLYYDAHDANTTIGRYPDGAADVYELSLATIEAPNQLTSYVVLTDQNHLRDVTTGISKTLIASANGFRIRYGAQQLLVKSEDAASADVDIYTPDGRLVDRVHVQFVGGVARLSVAHLPQGFYVARATDDQQTRVSCKFMK